MLLRHEGRVLLLACCLVLGLTTRVAAYIEVLFQAPWISDSILEDENRRPLKGTHVDEDCGHTFYDLVYLVWDRDLDGIEDPDCFRELDGDSIVDSARVGMCYLSYVPGSPPVACSSGGFYVAVPWLATTGRYDTLYVIALNDTTWELATYFGTSVQHTPSLWEIDSTQFRDSVICTENNSWYTDTQIPGIAVFNGSSIGGNTVPGSRNVGMERIAAGVNRTGALWSSLRVDNGPSAGCVNDSLDIDSVKIYKEMTGAGFDPDEDSLIGEAEWGSGPPDGGTATVTFFNPETLSTDSSFYYIAFDIAPGADRTHCVSVCVQDDSYMDTTPAGCVDGNFPFCSADVGLPVEISRFEVFPGDKSVMLQWTTQTEVDNKGFRIYRSLTVDGAFSEVNEELIRGAGNSHLPVNYEYVDKALDNGTRYFYKLASVTYGNVLSTYEKIVSAVPAREPRRDRTRTGFNISGATPSVCPILISYTLVGEGVLWTELEVYDISGRLVKTLFAEDCSPGDYVIKWDGLSENGEKVSPGTYFCLLSAGKFAETKKMMVVD